MVKRIQLREVLALLSAGESCDISVVTYDREKRTGGSILHLKGVVSTTASKGTGGPASGAGDMVPATDGAKREPNHLYWGTLNLRLPNAEVRKVNTHLITHCNGMEVIW